MLNRKEIDEIRKRAKEKVEIACDEYHAHSVLKGCYIGDLQAIDTLKVLAYAASLESRLDSIAREAQKGE